MPQHLHPDGTGRSNMDAVSANSNKLTLSGHKVPNEILRCVVQVLSDLSLSDLLIKRCVHEFPKIINPKHDRPTPLSILKYLFPEASSAVAPRRKMARRRAVLAWTSILHELV